MISKAKWQKYIQKLAAIDQRAAEQMRAWIEANGLQDDDALIEYAYALATKYGEASGELACEMYDLMAQAQGAMVPAAVPAETATMEEVAKGTMWGKYHSPSQIPSILGRQVRQAGADTMIQNAVRDHAEWAWIPSGDTCAFCITLASRGWQDASRAVLKGNHAEHIHANCDCTFAISFDSNGRRMYDSIYDPDRYKDMYDNAEGSTASDRVNSLRRQMYQQRKDYITLRRGMRIRRNNLKVGQMLKKAIKAWIDLRSGKENEFFPTHTREECLLLGNLRKYVKKLLMKQEIF